MPKSSSNRPADAKFPAASVEPAPHAHISKRDRILAMLGCDAGATLAEIIAATGWQPHSARAMLSILRKQGHAIIRVKRETGESGYVLAGHA